MLRIARRIRPTSCCAILSALVLISLIVGSNAGAAQPAEATNSAGSSHVFIIHLRFKFFDPPIVVVHEGDTVVWVSDTRGGWHDVRSYDGTFASSRLEYGETFSHTFDRAGVYGFLCDPHVIDGMQGAIVVLPKGTPLPDPLPRPAVLASTPSTGVRLPALGSPDTITTVAGGAGNGGMATNASLYLPEGIALDGAGRLYIADTENCQVRRVDPVGVIVSIFGHESCGYGMGGDADLAGWLHTNHPRGVVAGPDGSVYVADLVNCRVRAVNEDERVTAFAGSGPCGASGDGGVAANAGLSPWGLAFGQQGDLYIADVFNCRVRKVDSEGVITTVAGNGTCGFRGDGGPATEASLFFPRDVAAASDGTLYIADTENCRVRRVQPVTGVIQTVVGGGACAPNGQDGPATAAGLRPWSLAFDAEGSLLLADRDACRLLRVDPEDNITTVAGTGRCAFSGDGGPARAAALNSPSDIAVGADGDIYVADTGSCRVRRIGGSGVISTVAGNGVCAPGGDGGPATSAGVWHAVGLVGAKDGSWFFSEPDTCRVRRVDTRGVVTTYAGTGVCGHSGDGGPARRAQLDGVLGGIALASDGTLYVAEGSACRLRRIDAQGMMSTLAGTGVCGFGGNGGPAGEAQLNFVSDVALDGRGSLYVAEPFNCRVRRITLATGIIDTAVGDGSCDYNGEGVPAARAGIDPWGVAVGPDGTLYIADSTNCRVRTVRAGGRIETLAGTGECGYAGDGGPAREAMLFRPYDVVVDQLGNVYVTDLRTFTVRKIDGKGTIRTVAGVGVARPVDIGGYDPTGGLFCSLHNLPIPAPSYLGDGGPAADAGLYFPYGIALDYEGHLYIADTFDHRVRRVTCGGKIPCAGPAAMATEPPSDSGATIAEPTAAQGVPGLPSTGHAGRGSNPALGLLGAAAAALLLAVAARLPKASISRRGRGERRGET
jgi:plastocyanin/sugar lactone lactonase YvrE